MVRARELLPVPEAAYKYKAQGGGYSIEAFDMSSERMLLDWPAQAIFLYLRSLMLGTQRINPLLSGR